MRSLETRTLVIALGLWLVSTGANAAPEPDAVFLNGKVYTADAADTVRQAFAVRGDRFVAVGTTTSIRKLAGPHTRVVDLKGRFVTPGLADAHFHSEGGGPGIDLSGARSISDLLAAVAQAAEHTPSETLLVSNSDWHEAQLREQRLPTARELDQAAPNRPVVLVRGGHSYILNTAALRKWNITLATTQPSGGAISRDAAGELTGELFDAAKALVPLPPPAPVAMADIEATQKALNPYGITAVRVPGFYKGDLRAAYQLLKTADADGHLTLRYVVYLPGFGLRSAADVGKLLEAWQVRQDEGDDWLRIGGVKLGVDGGFEGGHMREPYAEPYGKHGAYSGVELIPAADFRQVVAELNRLGWRPTTHAVGDAALDEVLDAYGAADRERPIAGQRWTVEHAFILRPEQLAGFKRLGVSLSVQDHLYLAAPVLERYWGRARAERVTPLKDMLDAGVLVAGGTDAPVIPFNPFWELYHFLSRDTVSAGVYGPHQAVAQRKALLRLVTINYAKLIGEEATKGSIEPGKLADFAVLTDDFLVAPPERIKAMKARATYVGGKSVYEAPGG